jgi:UDP-N-acetylglucosamine 4,6-dehydratase/5-epimerase
MPITTFFKNKRTLITGASGSIGSAVVKTLIKKNCKVIRALTNDENGLYDLNNEIDDSFKDEITKKMKRKKVRYFLGDVRDYNRCLKSSKNVDIVIHVAALKHVPICEYNTKEAYLTNVIGTKNMIKASIKNKVKRFIFISTDKVINPTSLMGKTKLSAENLILKNKDRNIKTKFSVIRFGNVFGSRGSVLLRFLDQIKGKKNITVTDTHMSRFFITIKKAVDSILEAIFLMKGGEIFIIKNMKAFKILDLAHALKKNMKKMNKIVFTGLRKGEKLYEELVTEKERYYITEKKNFFIVEKKKKNEKNRFKVKNSNSTKHLNRQQISKFVKINFGI